MMFIFMANVDKTTNESLSSQRERFKFATTPDYQFYYFEEDVKEAVSRIKKRIWEHPKRFEGIKSKTCLPLDFVEQIINEEVGKELI